MTKPSEKVSEWELKMYQELQRWEQGDISTEMLLGVIKHSYQEELVRKLIKKLGEKPDSNEANIYFNNGLQTAIEIIRGKEGFIQFYLDSY